MVSIEDNSDFVNMNDNVEIVSTDDDRIKMIGSLLSNDSSRAILKILFENEMTANGIALKTGLLVSLVIHHLHKLQEAGLVRIVKVGKNSKGHDMKYYKTTKLAVVILPSSVSEKAKKSKSLFNSLSKIYKFVIIGMAGLVSWTMIQLQNSEKGFTHTTDGAPTDAIAPDTFLLAIPISVILIGLVIERIILEIKNR